MVSLSSLGSSVYTSVSIKKNEKMELYAGYLQGSNSLATYLYQYTILYVFLNVFDLWFTASNGNMYIKYMNLKLGKLYESHIIGWELTVEIYNVIFYL